jgi:hypothetical protein
MYWFVGCQTMWRGQMHRALWKSETSKQTLNRYSVARSAKPVARSSLTHRLRRLELPVERIPTVHS